MCAGRTIAICCRSMILILMITGLILSIMAVTSCSFMEAVYEVPSNIVGGNSSIATGTMSMASALGLWQYETTNGCKSYLDGSGNNLFQHARSELVAQKSGVAAPIFALSVIFWMVLELCCSRKGSSIPFIKFIVAVFLTVTQICQGLTFLFFHSEQFCHDSTSMLLKHHCEMSKGSELSASALVMFVLSSALLSCTPTLSGASSSTDNNKTTAARDDDQVDFDEPESTNQSKNPEGTLA